MSTRKRLPKLCLHRASGQGYVTDPRLKKEVYLGAYGAPETVEAYNAWCKGYLAAGRGDAPASPAASPAAPPAGGVPLARLFRLHTDWAEKEYVKGGEQTSEVRLFRMAERRAMALYPEIPAADFGPEQLRAVRQRMADDDLSRGTVRALVSRLRRVFAWGVDEGMVPAGVWHALCAPRRVARSQRGRPTPEVAPVPWPLVEATLPRLTEAVRAPLLVQYYGAMRPGEVLIMRPRDLDRSLTPWLYKPSRHKNEDREGRAGVRLVRLGPRAREVLTPLLGRCGTPDAWVFPGHRPGAHLACSTVRDAVRLACLREPALGHWHPNQLRHAMATDIRLKYRDGDVHPAEAAQAALGHARIDMTERYAQVAADLAAKVAELLG